MARGVVHTRTHVYVALANPHLTCDQCGESVPRWHDPQQCGCGEDGWQNQPCGCQAGFTSECPSWGPADGCICGPTPPMEARMSQPEPYPCPTVRAITEHLGGQDNEPGVGRLCHD